MPNQLCSHCGRYHEPPFSKEMVEIYDRIQKSVDEDERIELTNELVQTFVHCFNSTDESVSDTVHSLVEDFHATGMEHHRVTMQLGRTLMRNIAAFAGSKEIPAPSPDSN